MADTNDAVQDTTTTTDGTNNGATDSTAKIFATKAEAEANKPDPLGKKKLFSVTRPDGTTRWTWSPGYTNAAAEIAREDGYMVSTGTAKEVTREQVAAKLATFTDDELAAMGLSRKKAKKSQT